MDSAARLDALDNLGNCVAFIVGNERNRAAMPFAHDDHGAAFARLVFFAATVYPVLFPVL